MTTRILLVDDEAAVRSAVGVNLRKRAWEVIEATDPSAALAHLHERAFDLVLTDVRMPGATGLDLLAKIRASWPETPVVVMSGYGNVADAVAAMKGGASDYLIKPIGRDELYLILDRALERRTLRAELVQLRRDVTARWGFESLVGISPAMLQVYEQIAAVADSEATVLLQGATGTGKELLARALHYRSRRASGPMVRINCTAIPEALIESELFGHERGAFTGAIRQHQGKFEQADGGTLFLDEVGELDLGMQAKLLRVLDTGEFARVGSTQSLSADVRVVAATNRNLAQEVAAGRFRQDLYYRLDVVTLHIPALSERREDIPLLVEHFVRQFCQREGKDVPQVAAQTLTRLSQQRWPGNVRQLEHAIERAVILHQGGDFLDIPTDQAAVEPEPSAPIAGGVNLPARPEAAAGLVGALAAYERALIATALQDCGHIQAKAARKLGISKSNLGYRIKKLGIGRDE